MNTATHRAINRTFADRAREEHVVGRWSKANEALPWSPNPRSRTHIWRYDNVRALVSEVADTEKAESGALRVLTMLNPGHPEYEAAAGHLYSGLQLLLPDEDMHAHRHAATAVRYVHESDGGWTAIDGTTFHVRPGDVVLTPAMLWHEHGNAGRSPVIWQDFTDDPLVTTMASNFFELHPSRSHLNSSATPRTHSQRLHFPWAESDRALENAKLRTDGTRMVRLTQPGGSSLSPTGDATFARLSPGARYVDRSTGARLITISTGTATITTSGTAIGASIGDTVAIPSWERFVIENNGDNPSTVFMFSERPILERLGLYRNEEQNEH